MQYAFLEIEVWIVRQAERHSADRLAFEHRHRVDQLGPAGQRDVGAAQARALGGEIGTEACKVRHQDAVGGIEVAARDQLAQALDVARLALFQGKFGLQPVNHSLRPSHAIVRKGLARKS